jgi:hypothetical protein
MRKVSAKYGFISGVYTILHFIKVNYGIYMIKITLMMKAASTSETSLRFYETARCNMPEGSHFHIYLCRNLKSHMVHRIYIQIKTSISYYLEASISNGSF